MKKPELDDHYIHFITSKTFESFSYFKERINCLILLKNIDYYRKLHQFKLYGFVIMPDHIHLMIEPPLKADGMKPSAERETLEPSAERESEEFAINSLRSGDGFTPSPIQIVMHDIKGRTAMEIKEKFNIESRIWQKSFYDVQIYSERFFNQKLTYIHNNPLRAGLVSNLDDYPWSSYQNYYLNNHSLIKIDYLEI